MKIEIDPQLCKGCIICVEYCPSLVFIESKTMNKKGIHVPIPEYDIMCSKCELCMYLCPDQAIKVYNDNQVSKK